MRIIFLFHFWGMEFFSFELLYISLLNIKVFLLVLLCILTLPLGHYFSRHVRYWRILHAFFTFQTLLLFSHRRLFLNV
jgi:hypothetical protein